MIRITVDKMFVTYIDAKRSWTWIRDRWKMVENFKVQEKLRMLNTTVGAINYDVEKRFLNIKTEEKKYE